MTLKLELTEEQISQIISEETKSLIEERQQLGEALPAAAVALGSLGARAAVGSGGALRWLGTRVLGPALKSLGRVMFTRGGEFSLKQTAFVGVPTSAYIANSLQAWAQQLSSNPDSEKILKLIPEDASEPLKDSMVVYSQEYTNFLTECCSYIFNATDFYSRAKEYIPTLGLDKILSGQMPTSGTIDYTPSNPSTEAIGRRQVFIQQANKLTVLNNPINPTPIKQESMKNSLASLVKKVVASEWQYARDISTEDRFPIKSESEAEKALLSLIDRVVSSAVNANKIVLSGVAETEKQAAAEVEKEGSTPEEARKQAQTAVSTNVKPTYQLTSLTQEDILDNKGVLKKFDRSLPSGGQQEGIVRVLQGLLQTAGIRIGKDGYFGPRTEKAVTDFQKRNQLEVTGRVDKQTMEELIESSVEQEINDAEAGDLLPLKPEQFGQQTEQGSDNSLPFPALVKKIERLESLLPKAKNSEKLKARIQRAKDNLQVRLAKRIERQQRRSKKMKITERQFMSVILEETKAILAEQDSFGGGSSGGAGAGSSFGAPAPSPPEAINLSRTVINMDRNISSVFSAMTRNFDNTTTIEEIEKIFSDLKNETRFGVNPNADIFDFLGLPVTTRGQLQLEDTQKNNLAEFLLRSILNFMKRIAIGNSKLKGTFDSKMEGIFSSSSLRGILTLTKSISSAMVTGKYTLADGGVAASLGIPRPSPPALGTSSGKGIAQNLPRAASRATGMDASDLPNDWKAFASKSEAHKAMAKAWLAATGGDTTISEAVALPSNSSFRSFVQWYRASQADGWKGIDGRGTERGPTAIASYLSSQAQPATEPESAAAEPESAAEEPADPVRSDRSVIALKAAGPAIGKAVNELEAIQKKLESKKGPTKTITYDFSRVDEFFPDGVAEFGNMMFAKGPFGNRSRAILVIRLTKTLLRLLENTIKLGDDATVEQNEQIKQTAEEIHKELKKIRAGDYDREPDDFDKKADAAQPDAPQELEESVKRRWQKLIKG